MRFGIATCDITPPFSTSMGGYGLRNEHFDGVNDPLTFTAVVLEAGGTRLLLGAIDLVTLPSDGRLPRWLGRIAQASGTVGDRVMINCQHTHGGPKLPGRSAFARHQGDVAAALRYADWLEARLIDTARSAAERMEEGSLWYSEGTTTIPMSRRCLRDGQIVNAPNPGGPVDDRMQLLIIKDAAGHLRSVGMRISCHPVATGPQRKITADIVGAWRSAFVKRFGGEVTPFFLQGAAGDMRPRHVADGNRWRTISHAELPAIGQDMLDEMEQAIVCHPPEQLAGLTFRGRTNVVAVPCEHRYTRREQLEPLLRSDDYLERMFATEAMKMLDSGTAIPDVAEYLVQSLWLNDQFVLVGLQCEPLAAVGRAIEQALKPATAVVLGYVGGCVSYAPDSIELRRGGYEARSYQMVPWTGPWTDGLEKAFIPAIARFGDIA